MRHAKALTRALSDLSARRQREMIAAYAATHGIRDVATYDHNELGAEARDALLAAVDSADTVLLPRIDVFGRAPGESSGKLGPGRELLAVMPRLVSKCRLVIDLQTGCTSADESWWDLVAEASSRVANARKLGTKRAKMMAQRSVEMRPHMIVPRWKPGGVRHNEFTKQQVIWKSRTQYPSWRDAQRAMDGELKKVSRGTLYALFGGRE